MLNWWHLMSWDISPNALGLHSLAMQVDSVAREKARSWTGRNIWLKKSLNDPIFEANMR